jgi:hypothetical protein
VPVGSDISGPHRSFCGAMNMKFREKDFLSFMRYMFVRSLFFFFLEVEKVARNICISILPRSPF